MRIYKSVEVKIEKVEKVLCNMCGKATNTDGFGNVEDYIHIEKEWGYGSSMDGEKHSIDLCQECYKEMIAKFKISIEQ